MIAYISFTCDSHSKYRLTKEIIKNLIFFATIIIRQSDNDIEHENFNNH